MYNHPVLTERVHFRNAYRTKAGLMPPTDTTESTEGPEDTETRTTAGKADRGALAIAAVLLLVCGGLIGYGVLNTEDEPKPRAVPTAEVTYEVRGEGTVELSYLAGSESGDATVETGVTLPWTKTVQVPLGKDPAINIVLDAKGGEAGCTLAIRGKHVQRATAQGEYGRATCTGALPAAADQGESR